MSKSVAVPDDLYDKAAEVAGKDQVSVEEFVSAAGANRLVSRECIESRARLFNREDFERAFKETPTWNARSMIGRCHLPSMRMRRKEAV